MNQDEYLTEWRIQYKASSTDELLFILYQKEEHQVLKKILEKSIDFLDERYKKWVIEIILNREDKDWKSFINYHIKSPQEKKYFFNISCEKNNIHAIEYCLQNHWIESEDEILVGLYYAGNHYANETIKKLWSILQKDKIENFNLLFKILIEKENEEALIYLHENDSEHHIQMNFEWILYAIETENFQIFQIILNNYKKNNEISKENELDILKKMIEVGHLEMFEFFYQKEKHEFYINDFLK